MACPGRKRKKKRYCESCVNYEQDVPHNGLTLTLTLTLRLIVIVDTNTARGENLIGSLHNRDKGWKKPRKSTQETYTMIMITKIIINTEAEKSSPLPLSSPSLLY